MDYTRGTPSPISPTLPRKRGLTKQESERLEKDRTRSRPLPEFAGDELFMRLVPDGADSAGKLSRKAKE